MQKLIFVVLLLSVCSIGIMAEEPAKVMNFIAVMDLNCGVSPTKEECAALTDIVIEELVKLKKYTVIDRANRDKILSEVGFQQTGCVDDSCSVEAGRLLGVGKLVVGKITKLGSTYLVSLQLINVQTGAVETSASEECKCELDGLITSARNAARKLMGEAPISSPPSGTQPQPASVKVGEMVEVPAGEFVMGDDKKTVRKVYLDAFQIDKYEVTNEQYEKCAASGACGSAHFDDGACITNPTDRKMPKGRLSDNFRRPNQPVVCVDWNQANDYCQYAGKRLPTEAEWEKAARGTDGRTYPWGEEKANCSFAVMNDGGGYGCGRNSTWVVGMKPSGASPYGAMDMAGNVWEWTADRYTRYYKESSNRNPTGPESGSGRVFRGGAWSSERSKLETSYRNASYPGYLDSGVGFRCAKTP